MVHLECEGLMVLQGHLENQEPLARMVRQVFQEVRVIKGTLEHLGRKEVLAWMVLEEMRANQESPEKEAK
jgi:cobyrinic acid a,c-diamide synthase